MFHLKSFIIFLLTVICGFSLTAQAETTQTTVTTVTKEIITPAPAPKEVVEIPVGYTSCTMIGAGFVNNVWYPERKVCSYTQSTEGSTWVQGYWSCKVYTGSDCSNWEWVPGHWVKTPLEIY